MPAPFYVSPEQIFRDKEQYARRGIEKGKDVIAVEYENGIVIVAENPQKTLNKIYEIYDRITLNLKKRQLGSLLNPALYYREKYARTLLELRKERHKTMDLKEQLINNLI